MYDIIEFNNKYLMELREIEELDLSPPSWINGAWGMYNEIVFRFTSDDFFMNGASFKNQIYKNLPEIVTNSIKETKKTDEVYEITVTSKMEMGINKIYFYSFKNNNNGMYIEAKSSVGGGTSVYVYDTLYRIKE